MDLREIGWEDGEFSQGRGEWWAVVSVVIDEPLGSGATELLYYRIFQQHKSMAGKR
jgi:hypothetical protein